MTKRLKLARAIELLRLARDVLSDIASRAGDVDDWDEGGDYYEVNTAIREFLRTQAED
jgi:hypothetical protein